MKTIFLMTLFILTTALSSCATLFSDSVDSVTIDTEPQGAEITFNGAVLGRTPLKVSMRRQMEAPYITIRKEGYLTRTGLLDRNIAPAAFANFLFFTTSGATSWGIDALTGNMFKYAEDAYIYILEKKGANAGLVHPLGYFVTNFAGVQREVATARRGENFAGLCAATLADAQRCGRLWLSWQSLPSAVLTANNGVELYRSFARNAAIADNASALQ